MHDVAGEQRILEAAPRPRSLSASEDRAAGFVVERAEMVVAQQDLTFALSSPFAPQR
jgi:hypothetical protein